MYNSQAMADSGIEVDLMSLIGAENDPATEHSHSYYELKSKVVVGSPVTEIKHASLPMRVDLKQQLQRQQLLEQEKREQSVFNSQSHSNSITVPRVVEAAEVPANILQVKTQLQHPTKYHVRQSQKRQVQHFLNEHQGSHLPIQSLPANVVSSMSAPEQQQFHVQSSSSAPDPELPSPLLGASAGADFPSNSFDLLGDLQSVDPLELNNLLSDQDLLDVHSHLGASAPGNALSGFEGVDLDPSGKTVSSCPTPGYSHQDILHGGILTAQDELYRKERMKKDNHNLIERRRRFNINDRIKELGGLLPKSFDPESRQNKGNILKASVDYIKSLQDDQRKLSVIQDQKKKTEADLRKVLITLNQMSSIIESHGIQSPHLDMNDLVTIRDLSKEFLTPPSSMTLNSVVTSSSLHPLSHHNSAPMYSMTHMDDLMDESSPVSGDPMLVVSAPVSPELELDDPSSLDFTGHFF